MVEGVIIGAVTDDMAQAEAAVSGKGAALVTRDPVDVLACKDRNERRL